jgi:hypothetical protein
MAIPEFSLQPLRTQIGFLRLPADDVKQLFEDFGFQCVHVDLAKLPSAPFLGTLDCVVVDQQTASMEPVKTELAQAATALLPYDCRIYLRPAMGRAPMGRNYVVSAIDELQLPPSGLTEEEQSRLGGWFNGELSLRPFAPFVHVLGSPNDWKALCGLILRHPAGPAPDLDLNIDVDEPLNAEEELLVRRAFFKCTRVKLVPLTNGLSGVKTFKAFAEPQLVIAGGMPHTYFVKLGERAKVACEYRKYGDAALENVPFHLGPRLQLQRCALGPTLGILVGDFVKGAQALRDVARDGRATAALANLFNETLAAWRRAAHLQDFDLPGYLSGLIKEVPEHRAPTIAVYLGDKADTASVKALLSRCPTGRSMVGVVHGDLHATNVMVRGSDAILIDLERVDKDHPLLFDMASLEAGLYVDGFIGDKRDGNQLIESLNPLYSLAAFSGRISHCHPSSPSEWYFECVRQIRMQALQLEVEPLQYAWILAVVLLKKSCNPDDFNETDPAKDGQLSREVIRAIAWILGAKILHTLTAVGPQGELQ